MYSSFVTFLSSGYLQTCVHTSQGKQQACHHKTLRSWQVQGVGSWHQVASSRQSAYGVSSVLSAGHR